MPANIKVIKFSFLTLLNEKSCINIDNYDKAFWVGNGYSLAANSNIRSIHATAVTLDSNIGSEHTKESVEFLLATVASGEIFEKVSAYFAYFVAKAFATISGDTAYSFIKKYYMPIAQKHGSIIEKTEDNESRAHAWSTAICSMLVDRAE